MRTLQVFNFGREIAGYKAIRIRKDRDWDEFRVEFLFVDGKTSEKDTYFTDDKQDAIDTAQYEFNRMIAMMRDETATAEIENPTNYWSEK